MRVCLALALVTAALFVSGGTARTAVTPALVPPHGAPAFYDMRLQASPHSAAVQKLVKRTADASYNDPVGDAAVGPDVRSVGIANDANGNIGIGVFYANRTCAAGSDVVLVEIDADLNAATGNTDGADYLLVTDPTRGVRGVARWNGSTFSVVSVPSLQAQCNAQGLDFWEFNRIDLGIGSGFNFAVSSYPDGSLSQVGDFAPDTPPFWNYVLTSASPTPPPTPAPPPPTPKPKPKPKPRPKTYLDAPELPIRVRYVGLSIRHSRLTTALYTTMKELGAPRLVLIACWSKYDWPSVAASVGARPRSGDSILLGFWQPSQPRWEHLSPKTCTDVQALMTSRQPNGQRASALTVTLHERVHAQGVTNEAQTNCYAVQLVYYFARVLQFPYPQAVRLEQLAVRRTRSTAPPGYWNALRCRDGGAWDLDPANSLSF